MHRDQKKLKEVGERGKTEASDSIGRDCNSIQRIQKWKGKPLEWEEGTKDGNGEIGK